VLARAHRIPLYVVCPVSTIDMATRRGADITIEERPAREVTGFGGLQWSPPGMRAAHPAFDVTPAALVSALITERGVVIRPNRARIKALMAS
jgi:methylthioribose-1-phosphate isomerase